MITFPNCKINLGLRVIGKRPDGYHDLDSVFYPIPLHDVLEIIPQHDHSIRPRQPVFTTTGLDINGPAEDNLCLKACALLQKDYPSIPSIRIHLHKAIPLGAGLGGGSADAAFTLRLLNERFDLGIAIEQLQSYALQIGSDCPFFLVNTPCYAQGRGELLEPLPIDLSSCSIVLVNPRIHISTAMAFAGIKPAEPQYTTKEILRNPITSWKHTLVNDFESPVFLRYPEIGNIKSSLYEAGALYAAMTGTGSTVFGIFEKGLPKDINWPQHYFAKTLAG